MTLDLAAGAELESREHTFGALDLFLFSAVSWHPHRIHFDQDYTREEEGHPDLLVHGPLQAVHLFQDLADQLPEGATIASVRYRHTSPLHVGIAAVTKGSVTSVEGDTLEVSVWMEKQETGERTTAGEAVVKLPA